MGRGTHTHRQTEGETDTGGGERQIENGRKTREREKHLRTEQRQLTEGRRAAVAAETRSQVRDTGGARCTLSPAAELSLWRLPRQVAPQSWVPAGPASRPPGSLPFPPLRGCPSPALPPHPSGSRSRLPASARPSFPNSGARVPPAAASAPNSWPAPARGFGVPAAPLAHKAREPPPEPLPAAAAAALRPRCPFSSSPCALGPARGTATGSAPPLCPTPARLPPARSQARSPARQPARALPAAELPAPASRAPLSPRPPELSGRPAQAPRQLRAPRRAAPSTSGSRGRSAAAAGLFFFFFSSRSSAASGFFFFHLPSPAPTSDWRLRAKYLAEGLHFSTHLELPQLRCLCEEW